MNSYFETQDAFAREPGEESLSPEEKKLFKRIDEIMEKAGPGVEVVTCEKVHISKLISLKVNQPYNRISDFFCQCPRLIRYACAPKILF